MLKEYWELTKIAFEKDNESDYLLWVKPLQYVSGKKNNIYLSSPNLFLKERVNERYLKTLTRYIESIAGEKINIHINVDSVNKLQPSLDEIPFEEDSFHKELIKKISIKPRPLPFLNPKYTFSRYIMGENNNLACIAAKKIVENPGMDYNPFFIYGNVGVGKTHLAQAMAHYLHEKDSLIRIIYVTAEQLLNDFVSALSKKNMHNFRLKYRNCDILIIDDIQFLENTDKTQNELFHIYNNLKNEGKQMVFTSDRSPSKLVNITDRLISRFKSGLVVEIKKPSLDMRKKILELKLQEYNIVVSNEIVEYIAENVRENIRDLESVVNRIRILYCDMNIKDIGIGDIKSYLESILESKDGSSPELNKEKRVSVSQIQKIVADYYHINYIDMKSKKRTSIIAQPRQIAMFLSKELTTLSTVEIGNEFGGRNHSTVIFAIEKVRKNLNDGVLNMQIYEDLKKQILG